MQNSNQNKKVFFIHGFEGSPNGAWRPWMMGELDKHDIYACALSMPNPKTPEVSEWINEVKRHVDSNQHDKVYLVGHSLGGTAILRYLETYQGKNIDGVVIISAPCHKNKNQKIDTFLDTDFNWNIMKNKIPKIAVIHGDNDPYVSMSDAEETAKELGGKLIVIPNGKHLNGSAGFVRLPECLDVLLEMTK